MVAKNVKSVVTSKGKKVTTYKDGTKSYGTPSTSSSSSGGGGDKNLQLRAGETPDAYKSRVSQYQRTLTPDKLQHEEAADIPDKKWPEDVGDLLGANNVGLSSLLPGYTYGANGFEAPKDIAGTSADMSRQGNVFANYIASKQAAKPPALANEYTNTYGISEKQMQSDYRTARSDVNNYTSQLNSIVAKQQADLLRLRGTGSEQGVTEAVYGGQQATINREAAIAALPVQASLAAAQGNLEMAQQHVDKLFQLKSQDALTSWQYKTSLIDSVWNAASKFDQARLDDLKVKEGQAFEMQKYNMSLAQDWAKTAIEYGQSSLASQFMTLDPKAQDFQTKFAQLQGKVSKPVTPKSRQTQVVEMGGKHFLIDTQTGETIKDLSGGTSGGRIAEYDTKKASLETDIARADELLGNSLGIKSSSGTYQPGFFGGMFTGAAGISQEKNGVLTNMAKFLPVIGNVISGSETSSKKGDFLSGVSYIVNNQTFDKLTSLKEGGATFGSLTEGERIAVGRAASDLAASIITDDAGNITGFRGSEEKLVENLTKVRQGYAAAQDQLNIEYLLDQEDLLDASATWNN
jgi:hypothetical protein